MRRRALECLTVRERLGEQHYTVMATTCACIAGVLADLSRSEEALNYSRTCLAMRLAVLGERHVNTASIFH